MKHLFLILAMVVLGWSCAQPAAPSAAPVTPPVVTPPVVVVPPPAGFGTLKAVFYDGTDVKLWDGSKFVTWKSGTAVKASGSGLNVAIGTTLYSVSTTGATTEQTILRDTPQAVAVTPKAAGRDLSLTAGSDVWSFTPVSIADMNAAGNFGYYDYTHVYKNGVEQNEGVDTWLYGLVKTAFQTLDGSVIADTNKGLLNLTTPRTGQTLNATTGSLDIWQDVTNGPTYHVADGSGTYDYPLNAMGPFVSSPCTFWLEGSTWYSSEGQTWSAASGWNAYGSALKDFPKTIGAPAFLGLSNGTQPFLVYAGDYQGLSYLIEAVTGHLVAFDASQNLYSDQGQLFMGQTTDNSPGYARTATLLPTILGGVLYWHYGGSIWQMDLSTKVAAVFMPDQKMWVVQ